MIFKWIVSGFWLAFAIAILVLDTRAGRPVSSWVQVGIICSAVWMAAA